MQKHDSPVAELGDAFSRPVLVLTQHPEDYAQEFCVSGLEPVFASSMKELLGCLKKQPVSGFVLEVDEVWNIQGLEREHLFHLSEAFPLLRARRKPKGEVLTFLNDPEEFVSQVYRFFPRRARHAPRVPVVWEALVVAGDGVDFKQPRRTTILDVSASGGLLNSQTAFDQGDLLQLRIPRLNDPAPISAAICWRGRQGQCHARHCAGVSFTGITSGQARELEGRVWEAAG